MKKQGILLIILLLIFLLSGCKRQEVPADRSEMGEPGGRLVCSAETEEEAREIAQLYGIEFVEFRHGMALFTTEEKPSAVIERGREQGWPELVIDPVAKAS